MNILLTTLSSTGKPRSINIKTADTLVDKVLNELSIFKNGDTSRDTKENVKTLSSFLEKKEFDFVVGNPPYRCFGLRSNKKLKKDYNDYLKMRYNNSAQYKVSYYPLFIERGIELLRNGGRLAYILPDSFLVGKYFEKIRSHILDTCKIEEIVMCGKNFWEEAEVGFPIMIKLQKESNKNKRDNFAITVKWAENENHIKSKRFLINKYKQSIFLSTDRKKFELYFNKNDYDLVNKMRTHSTKKMQEVIRGYSGVIGKKGKPSILSDNNMNGGRYVKALHSGSELESFHISYKKGWLNLDPKKIKSGGDSTMFEQKKILMRQTGDSIICAVDSKKYYHTNNIHNFTPCSKETFLEWVAIIFNSKAMNRFYKIISMEQKRPMAQIDHRCYS